MRMFLVGMCDIFLLLYLTALAQVDARRVSKITVKDYLAVKKTGEELEQERGALKANLQAREEELARLSARLTELQAAQEALDQARQRAAAEKTEFEKRFQESERLAQERERAAKALEEEVARTRLKAGEFESKAVSLEQARTQAEESARTASLQAAAEKERAERESAAALRASQQAEEQSRLAEEARRKAEEARMKEDEMKRLAAEREKMAEEALRLKAEAEQAKEEGLRRADQAERAQVAAQALRRQAEQDARLLRREAEQASLRAREAEEQAQTAALEVSSMKQPAAYALSRNIKTKLVQLDIRITLSGTFGDSRREAHLKLLPVMIEGQKVVIAPLMQVLEGHETQDVKEIAASVQGVILRTLYLSPSKPAAAAFVVPDDQDAVPVLPSNPLSSYMPTLIAVRNGSRPDFGNRLRNLDQESFAFQRDRLSVQRDGSLGYLVQGFRGSYDFGEQILPGDQIVDLNGAFLGLALRENEILPVHALRDWKQIRLPAGLR